MTAATLLGALSAVLTIDAGAAVYASSVHNGCGPVIRFSRRGWFLTMTFDESDYTVADLRVRLKKSATDRPRSRSGIHGAVKDFLSEWVSDDFVVAPDVRWARSVNYVINAKDLDMPVFVAKLMSDLASTFVDRFLTDLEELGLQLDDQAPDLPT